MKETYFAHLAENQITTPMHVYTNDFSKILIFNINNRVKHGAKFYAWLEINENSPIQTKLLVNCVLSSILYGCEAWGDISCIEAKLVSLN